jgi:hypothetical protein
MITLTLTHYAATEETKERWVATIPSDPPVEVSGTLRSAVLQHAMVETNERLPGQEVTISEVEGVPVPPSDAP